MKTRVAVIALYSLCLGVFAAGVVWPTFALLGRCLTQGEVPTGGFQFSVRQLGLLWRSIWLSAAATVLCIAVSLPAAYVFGRAGRLSERPWSVGAVILLLLTPPMVCAFGWEHLLPATFNAHLRCIGVWAMWAWPIPALLIGAGWSRGGREMHEAALLNTSSSRAFLFAALPQLRPHVSIAALVVFLLCFRDYTVPHACGLIVFSTELLGWARNSTNAIDTVWPSLPSVAVTAVVLLVVLRIWRTTSDDAVADESSSATPKSYSEWSRPGALAFLALACFFVSWVIPVGGLFVKLGSIEAMAQAVETYGGDLAWSLSLAGGCGVVVVLAGFGLAACGRWNAVFLPWSLAFGALPGALIGESLVAAYNHRALWWVYDHWPVIALCYVARFSWIGVVAGCLAVKGTSRQLIAQSEVDGAGIGDRIARIHLPLSLPTLVCGAGIVMALSISEVAASSLVRVPPFSLVSHILLEKFHRFEYGMLVSLSLWLVAAGAVPAVLLAMAMRRNRAV